MNAKQLCCFQMLRAETGQRSEPFTMTVEKLGEHLNKIETIDEIKDDYVLVLMEFGQVDETVTDYKAISKNGVFSSAPCMRVSTFLSLVEGV